MAQAVLEGPGKEVRGPSLRAEFMLLSAIAPASEAAEIDSNGSEREDTDPGVGPSRLIPTCEAVGVGNEVSLTMSGVRICVTRARIWF